MSTDLAPLVEAVRADLVETPGPVDVPRVARLLTELGRVLPPRGVLQMTAQVRDHVEGLGPLQDLARPDVTDLLVNGDGRVWQDSADGLRRTDLVLDPAQARELAVRLATAGGRRLDDSAPCADAHLPSGVRFHAVLPPLSPGGTLISLRFPASSPMDLDALERAGAFPPPLREVLEQIVSARLPFLISGGTGTGKSTLLAAMLATVPPEERIVVVEDALELQVDHPHAVSLQSRHANTEGAGAVALQDLVRQSLRMRPDRVVLGECRGAEILDLLQALNTGHEGGCGTIHANTAGDVPARLEALGALGGLGREALAAQAVSALEVIIHLRRDQGRRRLSEIALLDRTADGHLSTRIAMHSDGGSPVPGEAAEDLAARLRAVTGCSGRRAT